MSMSPASQVQLPPGWSLASWQETSQANTAGVIVQGVKFFLNGPKNNTTSVFIPYQILGNTAAVAEGFADRINQLENIQNLFGS